jgi:tetratricopeptide (TPR) repeat protein
MDEADKNHATRVLLSDLRFLRAFTLFTTLVLPGFGLAHRQAPQTQAETRPQVPSKEEIDGLLQEAQSTLDQGRLQEAEQITRRYLGAHPDSADAHFLLGHIFFKASQPKASLPEFTEGAKFRTPTAFDLKIVALDYILLGAYPDADSWLTKSLQWNPKDSQGWYYLGRTKYNENRLEEAIRAFDRCLEVSPENVKAETNLGLSYEGLARTEDAFAAYRKAIGWQAQLLNPNPAPLIELGRLLLEHDRAEEALPYLRQAVADGPEDSRTHEQLGKAYSRLNKLPEAQEELEKAVGLAPSSASLHFMLGQIYRKRGMTERAKIELERGAALNGSVSPKPSPLD